MKIDSWLFCFVPFNHINLLLVRERLSIVPHSKILHEIMGRSLKLMTSSNVTIKHVRSESMFRRLHKPQLLFSGMLNWVNFLEKKEIKKCVREYKVRSGKRHHNAVFNRQDTRTIYPTLVRWCHTRRSATTIFSATQHCNIVATLFWMVTTLFQHCNAVLR